MSQSVGLVAKRNPLSKKGLRNAGQALCQHPGSGSVRCAPDQVPSASELLQQSLTTPLTASKRVFA